MSLDAEPRPPLRDMRDPLNRCVFCGLDHAGPCGALARQRELAARRRTIGCPSCGLTHEAGDCAPRSLPTYPEFAPGPVAIGAAPRPPLSEHDPVDHPSHYVSHPSGVECIQVTEHMGFNLGNAIKYIWRADLKGDAIEDLKKARWYVDREIARRGKAKP